MANDNYKRAPGKGKFALLGVDLVHPPDLMPAGRAPYLLNVVAARQQGVLQARSGTSALNSPLDQTNVHSLARVTNNVPGANPAWARFVGAGTKLYSGQTSFTSRGTGYSGNPLSLVTQRPPQSPEPYLYAFDSAKQAKYNVAGTEYPIGVNPPPEPSITQTAPILKDLGQYTSTSGWAVSDAASNLTTSPRVPTGTTVSAILYDVGSTGWASVLPSNTAFVSAPTARPTVVLNGWGGGAHVGAYEMGVDQGHGWGTDSGSTAAYANATAVADAGSTTFASAVRQHTHSYIGCIWAFSGVTTTLGSTLNVLSAVPESGTDGLTINKRSAGIWYSTDGGTTWTMLYDSANRAKAWDTVLLPAGVAYSQIQVMAFTDAHDDMAHYVYEINLTNSPHNSAYSFGARLLMGAETVTAYQLFANLPSTTVQAVAYDGSGIATVQPTLAVKGVSRDRILAINSQNTRVLDVTEGPDGAYSFRVKLAGIVAGQTIGFPVSFRTYAANTHAAGESISSGLITVQLTPSSDTAVGVISYNLTADLTSAGGRPLTDEDYMHVSLRLSTPANVTECHVMVDVDSTTNDFTGNYYYYVIRQNDLQQVSSGAQSTADSLIAATTNQVALSSNANSEPGQLPLGDSQYLEATIHLSDLIRVGSDPTVNLSSVKAIGIRAIVTGATMLQVGSWWAAGTYGPDANWNDSGNQGTPILYRYRYRSSSNGAMSNPSPATRSGVLPARNGVAVSVIASSDPQIDLIDIERNGGTFDAWHQSLTVPNTTAVVTDDVRETIAFAMDALDLGQYQPWPVTGALVSTSCNVVGTRVTATSGTPFNTAWVPGTEIIIGNKTYTLFAPPESSTVLTLAQNAGYQTGVTVRIPEPTIAGQPLPWACLGPDGRMFATGDPLNPGLLYWTNAYVETASDRGYIEITNPSEPLGPPRYIEGAIYVTSSESLYRVESTPGSVNSYTAYKLAGAPGYGSPWAISRDGSCYLGPDGIYAFNGSGAESLTDKDLLPLFPNEGRGGNPVAVSGVTIYPPDYAQSNKLRLARTADFVFFDYADTQGASWTLVFSKATKGWVFYSYLVAANLHYEEEGVANPATLIGHSDGVVSSIGLLLTDRGSNYLCVVKTPADDQGDTRARKQYGDLLLDYGGITAGSSAAGSGGTSGTVSGGGGTSTGGGLNDPVTIQSFVGMNIGVINGVVPGSLSSTSSTMTITGSSGSVDYQDNTADNLFFSFVRRNPPVTITARMTTKSENGNIGIMMRQSLDAGSVNWLLGPTDEYYGGYSNMAGSARQFGDTKGHEWLFSVATGLSNPSYPNFSPPVPIWMRMHYDATGLCSGWWSLNGTTWTPVFSNRQLTTGNVPVYLGICGASRFHSACAVVWDNISVVLA